MMKTMQQLLFQQFKTAAIEYLQLRNQQVEVREEIKVVETRMKLMKSLIDFEKSQLGDNEDAAIIHAAAALEKET